MTKDDRKLTWHVYARGTRRLKLFHEEVDYWQFLGILRKAFEATGIALWAYVLMGNHYHFILTGTREQLTEFMRWLNHSYSVYHNRKYGFKGHAFERSFRAHVQKSLFLALFRLAYVFLNPVEAGMADRPEDYRWSSYRAFMGLPGAPLWLDPYPMLQTLADTVDGARKEFLKVMDRQSRLPKHDSLDKLTWTELGREQFSWLLDEAVRRGQEQLGEDPVLVALHWGHQVGIPPRSMQMELPAEESRNVSKSLYKFRRRLERNPALAVRISMP